VCFLELAAAAGLPSTVSAPTTPSAMPTGDGSEAPLTVGDGRSVELIDLGGPDSEKLLARVAADLGPAVDAVEAFWGNDWPHHIVLVAAGTDEQFRAAAGGGTGAPVGDVAAIAVADRVEPARRFAAGQRVVFAPGASAMGQAALQLVVTHEIFHYAARADTAVDAPRWLTEGVADFVARPDTALPTRSAPSAALPSDSDFEAAGPQRALAYDRAWWFARFVADDFGKAKLRGLYLAACGVGHPDLAVAVRDVLSVGLPDLLARWQQWLTG
jgi:hypothetical protein